MKRALLVAGMATAMAVGGTTAANASTSRQTATSVTGTEIGPANSWVVAVNDHGDVAGSTAINVGDEFLTHGFFWHAGTLTDLGFLPGGNTTDTYAVNESGEVVGDSGVYGGTMHAFAWTGGKMTDLGSLGGDSHAFVINDKGQIAGVSLNAAGQTLAVVWRDGKMTTLPGLGGPLSYPTAENAAGQVVGYAQTASGAERAVLWTNGKIVDLGPGEATGVNADGQVLVMDDIAGQPTSAYVWQNGKKTTLPAGVSQVNGLNDQGSVVGYYTPAGTTQSDGFVWRDGKLTDLGADFPLAIDCKGRILAYTPDANDNSIGLVLDQGNTITLAPAPDSVVYPAVISDSGLVGGITGNEAAIWQLPTGD